MSNNSLAVREFSYDEIERSALAMAKSGYFQDAREQSQAIVKILAGREMGFGPFASMTGVYIISGRPSIGANLMASAVKRSGRYDYRVIEMTDTVCELEYLQAGKPIGRSRFTIEDAKKAGTKNTDKFPRNMLFARAMSNGVRWYCPDVFDGAAVYTPEELGATVNEQGDVIDAVLISPAPKPAAAPAQHAPIVPPAEMHADIVDWPADFLQEMVIEYKANHANQIKNALKGSCFTPNQGVNVAREWMAVYKEMRNMGADTVQATKDANAHFDPPPAKQSNPLRSGDWGDFSDAH